MSEFDECFIDNDPYVEYKEIAGPLRNYDDDGCLIDDRDDLPDSIETEFITPAEYIKRYVHK